MRIEERSPATPEQVARAFYAAFTQHKAAALEPLYAPDVYFRDGVFEFHDRDGTMRMWRKLLRNPKAVTFRYEFLRAEGDVAVGRWEADYKLFGRPVHNVVESHLTVKDGRIVKHLDEFPFATWAKQALPLGPLAHLPPVRWAVRRMIRSSI